MKAVSISQTPPSITPSIPPSLHSSLPHSLFSLGKTTTLKGLLNSLHLREYQRFYKGVLAVAEAEDVDTERAWSKYR